MIVSPASRNGKNGSLLDEALSYCAQGWTIIPTRGKKPACKWKRFQQHRPSEVELRQMFALPGIDGLAVVLGKASGELACRDFDDLDAYRRWKEAHPKLAGQLPTVRTARGRHVYFRGPEGFEDCGDGEYRADSLHYCLLPPSRHPDGLIYRWVVPLANGRLLRVNPVKAGLCGPLNSLNIEVTQQNSAKHKPLLGSAGLATELHSVLSNQGRMEPDRSPMLVAELPSVLSEQKEQEELKAEWPPAVEQTIAATLPTRSGQRNRKLFDLARRLKALPELADAERKHLHPIVLEWHRRAQPVIATKGLMTTWIDFNRAWKQVKYALGHGPVDDLFRRAAARKPPRKAIELYPGEPKVHLLAALCRELQRTVDKAEFFHLDARTAGRLLEVSHVTAWSWLNAFVADGILVAGEKGSQATRRANEYHYVG